MEQLPGRSTKNRVFIYNNSDDDDDDDAQKWAGGAGYHWDSGIRNFMSSLDDRKLNNNPRDEYGNTIKFPQLCELRHVHSSGCSLGLVNTDLKQASIPSNQPIGFVIGQNK
ncbi:hypothetical protein PGTUg99_008794 [Puccinia graminis f. sp. tritici]|uniref:Uncharacterized protein n=1 Tax=Puccinia graminis f. sp. tritici TaxID=56615 RepID=A0A5B0RD12_PUCGR|nr:hypothetical protein PGTUg99_008794 [Puccinia graminis f. sp. tritici]